MLHPSITRSIEEIESALFSDDAFSCPKENYLLAGKLISWLDRLQSLRELPTGGEEPTDTQHIADKISLDTKDDDSEQDWPQAGDIFEYSFMGSLRYGRCRSRRADRVLADRVSLDSEGNVVCVTGMTEGLKLENCKRLPFC